MTTVPALMEGVEKTNAVVVRGQRQGQRQAIEPLRRDPYAIEVNEERNCYACGGFGHMAQHCRNRGQRGRVGEERRVKYGQWRREGNQEQLNNLKEVENLESLD